MIFKADNGGSFSDAATTALIRRMHARQKALDGTGWIDPDKSKREGKICIVTAHGTARSGFRTWPRTTVSATTAGTIRKRLSFACCTVKLLTTTTEPTTELA